MAEKKTQEQIVKEKMDEIKKEKEAKAGKQGTPGSEHPPEKTEKVEKTKEELAIDEKTAKEKKVKEARETAEAQVMEDKHILETQDNKLDDKQKARKVELKKVAAQKKVDDRIGELTKGVKTLEGQLEKMRQQGKTSDERFKKLETEKAALEKKLNMTPEDESREDEKKAEKARIDKYIEEDKAKPREERREMTIDELADWLTEDMVAAQRWIADNTLERRIDRETYREAKGVVAKRKERYDKQKPFLEKVLTKHPELDVEKCEKELKAEGKNPKEIHEILMRENEKYRIVQEIVKSDPKKYLVPENGPELVGVELDKRLTKPDKAKEKTDAEKKADEEARIRDDAAEAERQRQANLDEGVGSSREREEKKEKSELDKERERLAKKVGVSAEMLEKGKVRRKSISGAGIVE